MWHPDDVAAPTYLAGGSATCVNANSSQGGTYTLAWTCRDAMLMDGDYRFTIPVGTDGTYNVGDSSYTWTQPQSILLAYQDTNDQWWSGIEGEAGKAKITEGPPNYVNPTGAKAGKLCYATAQ